MITDRLDSIERRLGRIETAIQLQDPPTLPPNDPPADPPTTAPATPVRADTFAALRNAILDGATWIQTAGIDMNGDLDARGAVIELLPGGPNWKPAISLSGDAMLLNATIKTPPSIYNAKGQRTGFNKALAATGRNMALKNVTFAPDTGFCIHLLQGKLNMETVKATTFSEYFIYQEPNTNAEARWCEVRGGSKAESVWRTAGGRYTIEDSTLDNSAGGKAVLRGDSPALADGSPGGIVRRTKLVGQVGPNPLTEDDGGQMLGIDRWRFSEGWIYQLDGKRKAETVAFARQMYLNGSTAEQIVRACADKFIDATQLSKVAKGKTKLSDNDIKLTLDLRAKEVGRQSHVLIENCEIRGDLRLNARVGGTIRNTIIQSTGDNTPISGNSQLTYPYPVDRIIVSGEQHLAPAITFDGVEFRGGPSLGIDLKAWTTMKFINGTRYQDKLLAQVTPERLYNSTMIDIAGTTRIRTDGGLTYSGVGGQPVSAWVGGYDGPGGTGVRPADWKLRWRDLDGQKLRAYARALKGPIFVLDIEHWEVDPHKHGEETAKRWLMRMAEICRIIKAERPDLLVGSYDILPASEYWALVNWGAWQRWKETGVKNNDLPDEWWGVKEAEYRTAFDQWRKLNDFTAEILLPHIDALFPNIYPSYRMTRDDVAIKGSLLMDADVVRLKVGESLRLAGGKPVYPLYWPVITEDGGELADDARSANSIDAALEAGATGIVIWSDQRPQEVLEKCFRVAGESVHRAAGREK